MRSPRGASRSSKGRWARRLFVVSVVSVLLMGGIAQAGNLGWWERASYNGYALCGYEYTAPISVYVPPAYGQATTVTNQYGSGSCYPDDHPVVANQYSGAALWLVTPYGYILCGSANTGYANTASQTAIAANTGCTGWHGPYAVCMQVGGWITGTHFPETHFPMCASSTYY
jgi:hypothetical protein